MAAGRRERPATEQDHSLQVMVDQCEEVDMKLDLLENVRIMKEYMGRIEAARTVADEKRKDENEKLKKSRQEQIEHLISLYGGKGKGSSKRQQQIDELMQSYGKKRDHQCRFMIGILRKFYPRKASL